MAASGKNPKTPPLYPAAEAEIDSSMDTIEPSLINDQQVLKLRCLQRDGYRCVVSSRVDGKYQGKVPGATTGPRCRTECAHILPFALKNFDLQNAQQVSVALVARILTRKYN